MCVYGETSFHRRRPAWVQLEAPMFALPRGAYEKGGRPTCVPSSSVSKVSSPKSDLACRVAQPNKNTSKEKSDNPLPPRKKKTTPKKANLPPKDFDPPSPPKKDNEACDSPPLNKNGDDKREKHPPPLDKWNLIRGVYERGKMWKMGKRRKCKNL